MFWQEEDDYSYIEGNSAPQPAKPHQKVHKRKGVRNDSKKLKLKSIKVTFIEAKPEAWSVIGDSRWMTEKTEW